MNDPFWRTAEVPSFTLSSPDLSPGEPLPQWARSGIAGAGGEDRSPALEWSGAPAAARSFIVTMFDPDAPTLGAGWWHWAVAGLPAGTSSLPQNAGDPEAGLLPAGALQLRGDAGVARYLGAAPPSGHGAHRYFFVVSALDVEGLDGLTPDSTPTHLAFLAYPHTIARAVLQVTSETP